MVKKEKDYGVDIALIARDIAYIKAEVTDIKKKLDDDYVTQDQFDPIRKIVYGLVGLILTAVVGALVGLVLIK